MPSATYMPSLAIKKRYLGSALNQHVTNVTDSPSWVKALRTYRNTVLDAVATEDAEWVIQVAQTLLGSSVTAIRQEAVRLQQASRTDELVRIPPERRAAG